MTTDGRVPPWLRTAGGWAWRLVALAVALGFVIFVAWRIRVVLIGIFVALVITSVLRPLRDLYARRMPRGLAVALSMLSGLLVIAGLITFMVVSVSGQIATMGSQFAAGIDQILHWLQAGPLHLNLPFDQFNQALSAAQDWINAHTGDLVGRALGSAGAFGHALVIFMLSIFCTVFFLSSGKQMWRWFVWQFPRRQRERWHEVAVSAWSAFSGYAHGVVLIALVDFTLASILFTALRIPLAAPLALLVFLGAFIPLIGSPMATAVAGVVALAGGGPVKALIAVLGVAAIGQIEGHLLQPMIMARQVRLHPVAIAVGVASGTMITGILGAILAVPLMAVAWSVYTVLRPPVDESLPPDAAAAVPESRPARPKLRLRRAGAGDG